MLSETDLRDDRETAIRTVLRDVYDPELGANLVDLNMVRRVEVTGDHADVDLVLSVPECPLAGWIVEQARQAILRVTGINSATVQVLDEPWRPQDQEAGWRDWLTSSSHST